MRRSGIGQLGRFTSAVVNLLKSGHAPCITRPPFFKDQAQHRRACRKQIPIDPSLVPLWPPRRTWSLAARPPPAPAPDPTPSSAAEIFRVPPPFRRRSALSGPLAPLGEAATFAARPPPAPAPDPTPGRRRAFQSPASLSSLFQGPACERRVISRRRVCNHGRHALPFGSVLPFGRVIFTSPRENA